MRSTQSVVINLGSGDLHQGFPRVVAQLWSADYFLPEQFVGSLPAAPELVELYERWQSVYQYMWDGHPKANSRTIQQLHPFDTRLECRSCFTEEDDELEIDATGITNVSIIGFEDLCQKLHQNINDWLKSFEFLNIERQLRSTLDPTEALQVIVETDDESLRRLPWHRWDLFSDYPLAETSVSRLEYKRHLPLKQSQVRRRQVRILVIQSSSQDLVAIDSLQGLEDLEVVYAIDPTNTELTTQLEHPQGWDIVFFNDCSGHVVNTTSQEDKIGNGLTIEQLQSALKAAMDNGLKVAFFNTCDGMALASALEKLHIPSVVVMREPLPNSIAQAFFQHFLSAFAVEQLSLYLAVQQARRKLQGVEDEFPGASWLPVICTNPAVEQPCWSQLAGFPCHISGK